VKEGADGGLTIEPAIGLDETVIGYAMGRVALKRGHIWAIPKEWGEAKTINLGTTCR
jgi:hypothetical protein